MKKIPLTRGQFALVDDEDFEKVNSLGRWHLSDTGYAVRRNKGATTRMHRLIMNASKLYSVDHIDHDTLNNQKYNLRICTHSENMMNIKRKNPNSTGYTGVYWRNLLNKYQAVIHVKGKYISLGHYTTLQGAWLARRLGERLYFREFRRKDDV